MKGAEFTGVMFNSGSTFAYFGDRGRIGTGKFGGEGVTGVTGLEVTGLVETWR
jgi:hypothetical protein